MTDAARAFLDHADVAALCAIGINARPELIALLRQAGPAAVVDASDANDETAALIRGQFRALADEKIAPFAPAWHDNNQLIPVDTIAELGRLGVFGLTTPAAFGGSEMGAEAMCVVTEELSRGYIGVGSLGTRSEIACELIRLAGTEEQKQRLLPKLASGEILPTAVFTEPNNGSDLANLTTRAERIGDVYRIYGQQDLDHACLAHRHDDPAGAHRRAGQRPSRSDDVPCREAARHRGQSVSRKGHDRQRDQCARLSRHARIRIELRRLRGAGVERARRRRKARAFAS